MKDYKFNVNWFYNYNDQWLGGKGFIKEFVDKQTNALQIGCFEGQATVWLLDNILTHPDSHLTDIDPFYSETDLAGANFETVKKLYFHNLEECPSRLKHRLIVGKSQEELRCLDPYSFDFIYVDGSHMRDDTLEDAVLCHRLLKKNGIIIFDDYDWGNEINDMSYKPKEAIDIFMKVFEKYYKVIDIHYQVVLRKIL